MLNSGIVSSFGMTTSCCAWCELAADEGDDDDFAVPTLTGDPNVSSSLKTGLEVGRFIEKAGS